MRPLPLSFGYNSTCELIGSAEFNLYFKTTGRRFTDSWLFVKLRILYLRCVCEFFTLGV